MLKIQGDIAFVKSDTQSVEVEKISLEGFVIAEGEATGHRHVALAERGAVVEIGKGENGLLWMRVSSGNAIITHPEHQSLTITPGWWKVIRQREYDEIEEMRRVSD